MPVRGVDDDDVDPGRDQCLDALLVVVRNADRRTRAQAPMLVLAREGVLGRFQDVLDGDEPAELHCLVDDQHALETMPVHQLLGELEVRAFRHRDELVPLGHDVGNGLVEVRLEPEVAVGDDAHDLASLDDRQPREPVRALQRHRPRAPTSSAARSADP